MQFLNRIPWPPAAGPSPPPIPLHRIQGSASCFVISATAFRRRNRPSFASSSCYSRPRYKSKTPSKVDRLPKRSSSAGESRSSRDRGTYLQWTNETVARHAQDHAGTTAFDYRKDCVRGNYGNTEPKSGVRFPVSLSSCAFFHLYDDTMYSM